MAREKSGLLSAVGTALEIIRAIVEAVQDLGGSDDDVRRILIESDLRGKIAKLLVFKTLRVFKVICDCGKTLTEMINDGNYGYVDSNITQQNFPIQRSGRRQMEVALFHFDRIIVSEQAVAEMDKVGYRPATIEEFLALGASQPELQNDPMVALGSLWHGLSNKCFVTCLCWSGGDRDLDLVSYESNWNEHYRFAAVCK